MKRLSTIIRESQKKYIKDFLNQSQGVFIVNYSKVSAVEFNTLRQSLKTKQSRILIIKNTLASKILEELGWQQLNQYIKGQSAFVFVKEDPVGTSKILVDFRKDKEEFQLRGGVLEGRFLSEKEIDLIAKLPPKEVLYGQLTGAIKSVISRLLSSMKSPLQKIVICLERIKEKKA